LNSIPLKYRLLILFIGIGLSSMLAVSIYYFKMNEKAINERTFEQLTAIRVVKQRQLESFINDRKNETHLLASSDNARNIAQFLKENRTDSMLLTENLKSILSFVNNSPYYDFVIVGCEDKSMIHNILKNDSALNFQIKPVGTTLQILSETYHTDLAKMYSAISDFNFELDDNNPGMYVTSRITGIGSKESFIALRVSLRAINDIMLEESSSSGFGLSGESYLVGEDYLMRSTSRFRKNSVLKTKVKTLASIAALNGETGTNVVDDYRGISVFSAYAPFKIKELHWAILAEIDFDEAMIPLHRSRNDILYITLLLGLIIIGLSFFFASHIIAPIRKLRDAAQQIEEGNYNVNIESTNTDEVGNLVSAFNSMAKTILKQTNELKEREERLTHFYNATIDGIYLHKAGKTVLVNKALAQLTGYAANELMQMNLDQIIQPIDDSLEINNETLAQKKSGERFPVEIQKGTIDYKGEKIDACVIRDITKRKSIEKALEKQREQNLSAVYDGQEQERKRISRDLHDGLGQKMIALKLFLESTEIENKEETETTINKIKKELDDLISETRQISTDIMPPVLTEFGLEKALKQLCDNTTTSTVFVLFDSFGQGFHSDNKTITYLYRIAQESVSNALKHGNASEIKVQLIEGKEFISLMVEDNGNGFKIRKISQKSGNGIYNMKERIKILNGKFEITSSEQEGTLIKVRVPKK
jgi:PAS domain S-box-containing protein